MKLLKLSQAISLVIVLMFINIFGFDIFNISRFVSLIVTAAIVLSILCFNFKLQIFLANKYLLVLVIAFLLSVACSLFFSGIAVLEGLIGVYGRNMGGLTYIAFIIFMFGAFIASTPSYTNLILKILIGIGFLTSIYGFIQFFGFDPLLTVNLYNPIKGFFGNPNFQSAFLGITSIAVAAFILSSSVNFKIRVLLLLLLLQFQFIIYSTDSIQGFLVSFFGLYVLLIFKFLSVFRLKVLGKILIIAIPFLVIILTLDLLQRSPLGSILYQPSIAYRGDFWRAGIQMFLDNPLFGVGPDGYRDQFRFYRDEVSINRLEIVPPINSAHNIFIELAASGGIFLLVTYVLILLLVFIKIIQLVKKGGNYSSATAGAVGCFVGYLTQSIISVNTIPLGLIGWILFGLIIGLDKENLEIYKKFRPRFNFIKVSLFPLGMLIFIAVPMLKTDINFKKALESQSIDKILSATYGFPNDVHRMGLVAEIFRRAGMADIGLKIARDAVSLSPNNFEAWEELYQMPNLSISEKAEILIVLRSLDPLNSSISKG